MQRKRANDENEPPVASTSKRRRQMGEQTMLQLSSNTNNNNKSIRSGKIIRMHLQNFMCHANLQIDFNSQANLLVGRNGSGKSAILTALIIGLGSRASKTNRSATVTNLIKAGESSATVEIEISNAGNDAYDGEKYGDKIIIKRKILASGGSSYEIKDATGHIISKSREELLKIILFHNIQVDNPVFVLNQEAARTFLKDLNPTKSYTLFLKATQMELIIEKLMECERLYNAHIAKLRVSKKQLQLHENEVQELEVKYVHLKSVEDIKDNINLYKKQRLWLKVTEQENKIKALQEEIVAKEKAKCEIQNKISSNTGDSILQNESDALQSEVTKKNAILETENRKLAELKTKYEIEAAKYQTEAQQHMKLKERCKQIADQINTIEEEISKRNESCTSRNTQKRLEVENQLKTCTTKRIEIEAMLNTLKQEIKLNDHNKENQTEEYQTLRSQKADFENKININQQELNRITTSSSNNLDIYGSHMKSLLDMIERSYKARKFTALPKGPLGRYLQVPDKKWRGVVEQQLGGNLLSFIVNSGQDRLALDKIIKTHFPGKRITIITSKFRNQVYDVQDGAIPSIPNAHLLMNLIKCTDPDVMNCLIDQVRIETILLVEDQRLAEHLTVDESNVPMNLQKVVLLDPPIEYYPSPQYRAYSLNIPGARYIQMNMDDRKATLNEEINKFQRLQREIDIKLQSIRQTIGDFSEYQKQKQALLRKHESTLNQIKLQIDELNNYEFTDENADGFLHVELEKHKENLSQRQGKLQEIEANYMQLKQTILEYSKDVQKQQTRIGTCEAELVSLVEELNAKKLEAAQLGNNMRALNIKLAQFETEVANLKSDLDGKKQQLSEYEEEACQSGERVDTDKSASELSNLIKSLEVKVREICSADEDINVVRAVLDDKKLKLTSNQKCINSLTEILDLMKKSRHQRFKTLKTLYEHMAIKVTHVFKHILKLRNFEGQLEFNPPKQTLDMTVVPRDNHIKNAVSSTKSLSGGERSFATVALLLSLWSCVDHPFYFLDEYDVFTDEFNRIMITKLLLSEAEKKPHRQYTFLSPQDMSFVEASHSLKIHRLADPRSTS